MIKSFTVERLTPSAIEETAAVISEAFHGREPLAMQDESDSGEFKEYLIYSGLKSAEQGLGFIARHTTSGKIAGALIACDLADTLNSREYFEESKTDSVISLLYQLNKKVFNEETIERGKYCNIKFIAASDRFKGQGIVSDIMNTALQNASEKGFAFAHTEATGNISQHIFQKKFGFSERSTIAYSEFTFQGGKPFSAIQEHKAIKLLMKPL
ncbi:GNAT family N-acetyltransferase [Sansalvadorimonas verongulae]|uniref:GNAT family N-acetyltransferase n=1 Tax=Sansalvadorimonas verongulae TaxID=2172824 RepID=UPI0012BD54E9|nr:GNAT family N-acetyltransferase [Sansalvadorimonas verongulae]MTI14536.1 GNAT family N-acetyltransferase [Sansalvadorimonas verongulae]